MYLNVYGENGYFVKAEAIDYKYYKALPSHPGARHGVRVTVEVVMESEDGCEGEITLSLIAEDNDEEKLRIDDDNLLLIAQHCHGSLFFNDSVQMRRALEHTRLIVVCICGSPMHVGSGGIEMCERCPKTAVFTLGEIKVKGEDHGEDWILCTTRTCAICLMDVRANSRQSVTLDCMHTFHCECVKPLCKAFYIEYLTMTHHLRCPTCRRYSELAWCFEDCALIDGDDKSM
jgi:hypothetical protein